MARHIERPMKAKGIVHKLIAETAQGLAEAQWEVLAKHNAFYRKWPDPRPFVNGNWDKYIPMARAILTGMLGSPQYDQKMKDEIHVALLLDGGINPKKMAEPAKPKILFSTKELIK